MNKFKRLVSTLLLSFILSAVSNNLSAQPAVPNDPSLNSTNGAVGHPTGPFNGGANIDGGLNIFLLFALAYGTHRYYRAKRKEKELADNAIE
jgi:hypothetical protein